MPQTYTLAEFYAMIPSEPKTIKKWIEQENPPIEIIPDEKDKRVKRILKTDAHRIMKNHGINRYNTSNLQAQIVPISENTTELEERVATLEEKIDRLESQIKALLEQRHIPSTPRVKKTQEREIEPDDVPEGFTALFAFSRDHGIPDSTIKSAAQQGHFTIIREDHRIGGRIVTNWLDEENHAAAYHFWKHRPDFTPCPDCPTEEN